MITRLAEIYRNNGVRGVYFSVCSTIVNLALYVPRLLYFDYVRPELRVSARTEAYNGITVHPYRIFDRFFPGRFPILQGGHKRPEDYEHGLCNALRTVVESGDTVVVVGGGIGVTTAIAGQAADETGHVICFEGAANMITHLQQTLEMNEVPSAVDVRHAIVGEAKSLEGHSGDAQAVPVDDLPDCDVLEMDIEGAETDVLDKLSIRPQTIIVEVHGNKQKVVNILNELGYDIASEELAEIGPYEEMSKREGLYILTANRRPGS